MSAKYMSFNFCSKLDKVTIDAMAIVPEGKIMGVVQIVHGMCEHKERYYDFMEYLADKGYLTVIHDHRGHGNSLISEEDLGYFYDSGDVGLVYDTYQIMKMVKDKISGVPYIMIGHSMGSLVARCFVKKYDKEIDKLILLGSPSRVIGGEIGLIICKIMELFGGAKRHSKLLDFVVVNSSFEKRFKKEKLKNSWICSDRRVVYEYNECPKCNFTFTVAGYESLIKLMLNAYNLKGWKVNNPELPIHFISGKDDPCYINAESFGKSVHAMKEAGYENVTGVLFGGMRHEVLNEKNKSRVYKSIEDFIKNS